MGICKLSFTQVLPSYNRKLVIVFLLVAHVADCHLLTIICELCKPEDST
jgi:hypothetical protein